MIDHVASLGLKNLVIVSPTRAVSSARARMPSDWMRRSPSSTSAGRGKRAEGHARHRRSRRSHCLIVDDIAIRPGRSPHRAGPDAQGREGIYGCFTHAVLSGPAVDRIRASEMMQTVVTNTIPIDDAKRRAGPHHGLSVAGLLGEAIRGFTRTRR